MLDTLGNLFSNKLFLQYLSGAGSAIGQDESVAGALNKITQQNISAQSQAGLIGLLKQMLSGENDAEMKVSKDGANLKIPSDILKGALDKESDKTSSISPGFSLGANLDVGKAPTAPNLPAAPKQQSGFLRRLLNPQHSQLGAVPPSALAGLTPQDVNAALAGALNIENLDQKKMTDVIDTIYRGQLIKESENRIKQSNLPKDERTAAIKNYEYAVKQGYKGHFNEFQKDLKTAHQKDYEYAVKQGYEGSFHKWVSELSALRGGLTLGEKIEQKKAFANLGGQLYFKNPKWTDDLNKHMSSKATRQKMLLAPKGKETQVEVGEKISFIEGKISAGGGVLVKDVRWDSDGRTMIWTVRWPSGDIEEIKYAVRD